MTPPPPPPQMAKTTSYHAYPAREELFLEIELIKLVEEVG